MSGRLARSARRIGALAWPVFVGQLSVLAFSTVDTVLVARHDAQHLAALAVGAAAYVSTFVGLMGVVMGLGPVVGQFFGAGRLADAGRTAHQALWIAIALSVAGSALLAFPAPYLALARVSPEVEALARGYLATLAFSLPASLLFTVYRGFNVAVSRPKAVMALQVAGLAAKVPLSLALVGGVPLLGVPALGVVGAGLSTAIVMWLQLAVAVAIVARDPFYDRFALLGRGLDRPDRAALGGLLRLGLPMGAMILVEVSGFTFMALFIARLGTTPVAGHQIAANVVSMLFMLPLAIANGASALVAQRLGARDAADARALGSDALRLAFVLSLAVAAALFLARGTVVALYTPDAAVAAAALPLLAWVALFHVADAVQAVASFVLRAWRIAVLPLVVNTAALWGVGLGGGYLLAFGGLPGVPPGLRGSVGFWLAATAGLALTGALLAALLAHVHRRARREDAALGQAAAA